MRCHRFILILLALVMVGCDEPDRKDAARLTGGNPDKGKAAIRHNGCASCHEIPGITEARGLVGPPLNRMGARTYIGGVVTNTPANMVQWLQDPPAIDDKTAMPNVHLSANDSRDIAAYLYTLR